MHTLSSLFAGSRRLAIFLVALVLAPAAFAQFTVTTPTDQWIIVPYPPAVTTDYFDDQQTGTTESDIVGGGILPSFYTKYITGGSSTNGNIYYRIRLGGDVNPVGFKSAAFLGIDGNGDGKLDFFVGVDNSGSADGIYIWAAGTGANISPSTTSIDSNHPFRTYTTGAANYSWTAVNTTIDPSATGHLDTDNDGNTDYFLSFSIPFNDLVLAFQSIGISITSNSTLSYVMGTATQANSFNQDLNGVNGGVNSSSTWSQLGAITLPLNATGTVSNVAPVNTVPGAQSVRANSTLSISGVSVSDADGNLSTVKLTVTQGTVQVSLAGGATISAGASGTTTLTLSGTQAQINAALGTITYTPTLGYSGPDTLTVLSTDSVSAADSDTVSITVVPNSPPVAGNDSATTNEDTATTITVLTNDSDPNGDPLSVTGASVPAAQGTVVVNPDKTLTFTPAANFNGTATITYTISDGMGGTANGTVTVTVTPVNDPPVAVNDSATTSEDTATSITVLSNDSDVDGDTLLVTGASVPVAQGTVVVNPDKTVTYTPAPNFNGTATISYNISDGNGGTASATITVTITPVNDAPVAVNDTATTPEDTAKTITVLSNDSDVDGDTLTVTGASVPVAQGTVVVNPDKTVTYTPAANFNGTANISYTISDGNGGTGTATITVTVTAVNDPPVAVNDTATTPEDTATTITVLSNDSDVDGDTLTVTGAAVPAAQGTAVVNPDKTVTYTPAANFNGTATITYTISDGNSGTATATITVTVTAVNDPPVAVNDTATTPEDTAKTITVLGNDSDVDGDTLTVTSATVPAAQGTAVVNPDKTVTYTPAANFNGTATITYAISDGNGGTASASITVTVTPVNDAPVAVNDTATTPEDTAKTITVLTNDSDVDGDTLTVTGASVLPAQGAVVVNADNTVTFTPATNFNGTSTISYTISDGNGGTAIASITVTVTPVNDAPVAGNDSATTAEDTAKTITVLGNDSDPDGDTLTVTTASVPAAQGTVVVNADNTVTYTPAANFNGTATISYSISDGNGGTASASIAVTVTPVNDAPVAVNDTATTPEDTAKTITVLTNDSDVDGDTLTVTGAGVPAAQGAVVVNADNTVTFTPATNFNGTATISYTISDGNGGTATASITVTVTPVNDAPVAGNDSATTAEDTAKTITVLGNDSDADGDTLTVTSASVPAAQGTVVVNPDKTVTYTPAANFNGTATISYNISDGNGGTASATITVAVTPVNDAPVAVNDTATTPEDTAKTITVLTNDSDVDGDTLTVTSASVPPAQGAVVVNGNNTVTFTPATNFNGTATISYTISDGNGGTATASITVTVTPVNDAPVAGNDSAITAEDTAKTITVLGNDSDPDGDALTVTGASVPAVQGTVVVNADNTVTYTPAANFNGTATISYNISDGNGGTASASITVTVAPVNDAPVAVNDTATTTEDTAKTITVLTNDSDVDGDALTVTGANVPAAQGAVVVNADNTVTYTPATNFNGTATITYTISDGKSGTATATITVTVTPVNDAPVAVNDTATTPEDTAKTITVLSNDSDPDGDTLTVTSASVPAAQGTVMVNPDKTVTYTPAANFNGTATITYTISDGNSGIATASITVTVSPVNDAPVAANDTATTPEDTAKTIAILSNDSDPDGDTLTVTAASVPAAQGTVSINADKTVTYTPAANFNGTATISYTIGDGNGGTASATVTVTVTAVNDPPVAVNDSATTPEDTAKTITVLSNDSDPDGDTLAVTGANVPAAQGTVVVNADNTVTYTPAANFNGTATITYTIGDGNGGSATASITVTVTGVNDAPVAVNDSATTPEDTAKTITVLSNDSDPDGDSLTVTTVNVPAAQGTANINPVDNTVTFTPAANFNGTATISYIINDGKGGTATASIIVDVTPVNDAPVAVNDAATTPEDTAKTIAVLTNDSDVDGDTLIVTGANVPAAQGTATVNAADNTVTFTPAPNFNGTATITYTISDGKGGMATASIIVDVTPVNDAPVAVNDAAATPEDTATTITVLSNDSDPDGDTLTVTGANVPAAQGTAAVNADNTVTFTPAANFNGTATIAYTISDGKGGTATASITVTVAPVNDPPVAVNDTATITEDTATTITVLANDSDPDGDSLTVVSASVPAAQGTASVNGVNNTVVFTPASNFNGTAIITYTINDGNGGTATAFITVTVTAVNDVPVALNDSATTPENTAKTITVLANDSDADGDPLTVISANVTAVQGAAMVNSVDNTVTFTPSPGFNGTATIGYTISDGNGGTASASITVTVTPVNDAPVAVNDVVTTPEDTVTVINVLGNDSDPDGDTLTVTGVSVPAAQGAATVNPGDNTVVFTPSPSFNGTVTITYTISDGNGGTATASITVTVTAVNDAPVAANDTAITPEGRPVDVDAVANDFDPEGETLSVVSADLITGQGTVSVNADGTVHFVPAPHFSGAAVITYVVSDPQGGKASAQIKVTVDALPVALDDVAATTSGTAVLIDVLANDADPEGLPLTIVDAVIDPAAGTLTIATGGKLQFTPAASVTGTVVGHYTVQDAAGNIASANVLITITDNTPPAAPVAVSDYAQTTLQAPVNVNVLGNDSDPNGQTLTVESAVVDAAIGTVTIGVDGSLTFIAAAGFEGIATITYTIHNTSGATASAPVIVEVNGGNTAPIAKPDVATASSGASKTLNVLANDSDPDGDAISVVNATVDPQEGTVSTNPDGTLKFTPAPGFTGTAIITYQINDSHGASASSTVTVTVSAEPINSQPVAINDAASTQVGIGTDVNVLANDFDTDGDTLSVVSATVSPAEGTVTINPDGTLHFVPANGFNGIANISYSIADGAGGSTAAVLSVNVNDNPVAVSDLKTTPHGVPVTVNILNNDSDPNGNPISLVAVTVDPSQGTIVINQDNTITFTPASSFSGTALISYTITDGQGGSAEGTAYIVVNSPPDTTEDTASTEIDQPVTVSVLNNDSDPDGDTLTLVGATVDGSQGTVTANSDGTVTFTPAPTFVGPAVITYTVMDSNGATRVGRAIIDRANVAPTADQRTVYTYCATPLMVNAMRTATDRDADSLTVVSVSQPRKGAAVIQSNGYILYTPKRFFRGTVEDSFVVTISDGKGGTTQEVIRVRAFAAIAGSFQGLMGNSQSALSTVSFSNEERNSGIDGRITISLNDLASFTAKLELGSQTYRFRGTLTGALQFEKSLKIAGETVALKMNYDDMQDEWTVTLHGKTINVENAGAVGRKTKSKRSIASSVALSDLSSNATSAAVVRVGKFGAATIVGRLTDGNHFSSSAFTRPQGAAIYRWSGSTRSHLSNIGGTIIWNPESSIGEWSGALLWDQDLRSTKDDITELKVTSPLP